MEFRQLAPHVYTCLQLEGGLGASNSGLVAAGDGLVVDSFWDLPRTRALIGHYSQVHPEPPARLVNTHHNGDHAWGNQLFAETGTEIIGHRRCAEYMAHESPEMLEHLRTASETPPGLEGFAAALAPFDFAGITLTPPTTLIDDDTDLDVDGLTLRLLSVGPAHTAGDVCVFVVDEGVLFTGDVLFNRCTPVGWEGTFEQWIDSLDRLAALEPAVVVPGHGPVGDSNDLREMRAYLTYVYEESRRHHDAGLTPLEAARRIELGRWLGWDEPERLAFQVHRAYRQFRGEAWDTPVDLVAVVADMAVLTGELAAKRAAAGAENDR